jgi:DNA polymerase-3 subunit beta
MSETGVEISAKSSQVGSAIERLETFRYDGAPLKISFNSEFVKTAVKALGSEDVTFLFVGEMKPFVVKNASDDSIVQIVTPVRTY